MTLRERLRRVPGAQATWRWGNRAARRYGWHPSFDDADPKTALRMGYDVMLGRKPDPVGTADFLPRLRSGELDGRAFLRVLKESDEFNRWPSFGESIHAGRRQFIRSLPKAERILDLGGSAIGAVEGAMVVMGYPYSFKELVIIDLPDEDRHEIYRTERRPDEVETRLGTVRYRYHSMTDLTEYDDSSFDLVYSGQTIEHVSRADGASVFSQVHRVLSPGGHFALDTPNARVTRIQQDEFIDPDHKVEYQLHELVAMAADSGLEVVDTKGLNYAPRSVATGRFDAEEATARSGVFAEAADCYILCLVLRKPD